MADRPDWRDEYPFRSSYRQANGHRQHFVDEGQGEPFLFVHGNPTWSFYWRHLIVALRDDYRAIAPDHVGCGLSDKPESFDYSIRSHTQNLVDLIDELDLQKTTLVVHDWGGAIGLAAAAERPERFARIVILNTGAFPPPYIPWRIRACRMPLLGRMAVQGLNLFARAALRIAMADPSKLSPEARAGLLAPYDSWAHRRAIYRFVEEIPASPRHPNHAWLARLEESLSKLASLPTLMIWGMRDWCFRPECLQRLNLSFPDAEVHRLEEVGHYVAEEASSQVNELMQSFIARHPVSVAE